MIDNIDDITVSTPDYFLPVFNVCEFKVEGCPIGASIKTLIMCGETTYTDERATYKGKAQVDIAGYLRAFFTSFREDFVRHQQIYVEMQVGMNGEYEYLFDDSYVALYAISPPALPLGTPFVQRWYTNLPAVNQVFTVLNDGDAVGWAGDAYMWNQLVRTQATEYHTWTGIRAFNGTPYVCNPNHKYLAVMEVMAIDADGEDITMTGRAFVGTTFGQFNQIISTKIVTNDPPTMLLFTPQKQEYNHIGFAFNGTPTSGDSWTMTVYVHDLTLMYGEGNEPTTTEGLVLPSTSKAYNAGTLIFTNEEDKFSTFTGYKEFTNTTPPRDVIFSASGTNQATTHRFIADDSECGVMIKWLDAQGYFRYFLFQEGEENINTKANGNSVLTYHSHLSPIGKVFVNAHEQESSIETTTKKKLCATFSTEDDRRLLDTIHSAFFVWLVDIKTGNEFPVTIIRGTRKSAKGLQDYEIEIITSSYNTQL